MKTHTWQAAVQVAVLWTALLVVSGTVLLMLTAVVVVPAQQGAVLKAGWVLLAISVLAGYLFLGDIIAVMSDSDGSVDLYERASRFLAMTQFLLFVVGASLVILSTTGVVA